MTFATDIATIPYNARESNAAGFLPPIFRAIGHILFATALSSVGETDRGPDEDILSELQAAKAHWDVINTNQALSLIAAAAIRDLGIALTSASLEYAEWPADRKTENLRDLANRTAAIAAILDRELAGIRDSDPGYQL